MRGGDSGKLFAQQFTTARPAPLFAARLIHHSSPRPALRSSCYPPQLAQPGPSQLISFSTARPARLFAAHLIHYGSPSPTLSSSFHLPQLKKIQNVYLPPPPKKKNGGSLWIFCNFGYFLQIGMSVATSYWRCQIGGLFFDVFLVQNFKIIFGSPKSSRNWMLNTRTGKGLRITRPGKGGGADSAPPCYLSFYKS